MLDDVYEALKPFDPIDLLKTTGALQLCPENINCAIRIEALGHTVACIDWDKDKPSISKHRLDQVLNTDPVSESALKMAEDLSANLFTESFSFYGGKYIVFPGINVNMAYVLGNMINTIFHNPLFKKQQNLRNRVYVQTKSILSISDVLARRLGFRRYMKVIDESGDITFPLDLERKKKAVTFTKQEMGNLLGDISTTLLDPFITRVGELNISDYEMENSKLFESPIIHHEDLYIIAFPGMLLPALRYSILKAISEYGQVENFAKAYLDALNHTVTESLFNLGWVPLSNELPKTEIETNIIQEVWQLDTDKVCCAVICSEELKDIDKKKMYDQVETDRLKAIIDDHLPVLEEYIYLNTSSVFNEVFFLVVFDFLGMGYALGFSPEDLITKPPVLLLPGADLQQICLLEGGNKLALYKFAKASSKQKEETMMFPMSVIGEFELYREHKHSYYLNDEGRPDFILMGTAFGRQLREEVAETIDQHPVLYHDGSSYIDVINLHQNTEYPIYMPRKHLVSKGVELFVEINPHFWVSVEDSTLKDERMSENHPNLAMVVDFISYWLWQFRKPLSEIVEEHGVQKQINIWVAFEFEKSWTALGDREREVEPYIGWRASPQTHSIFIKLNPGFVSAIAGPENTGELECMGLILEAIANLWERTNKVKASQALTERILPILDSHKKPLKKKMLSLDPNQHPQLIPTPKFDYPLVKEADLSIVLENVGRFCMEDLGLRTGKVPPEKTHWLLNKIVGYLFGEFTSLVSSLNPDLLLEFLVGHYEAIVCERKHRKLTFPTRKACFEGAESIIEDFGTELSKLNEAARALRFIIEYVVARPPEGYRRMSFSVLDRLMALSAQIIVRGFQSDMEYYDLFDIRLEMLGSGRLAINLHEFKKAQEQFFHIYTQERLSVSQSTFSKWWEKPSTPKPPTEEIVELDNAFQDEYGFSLNSLSMTVGELGDLSSQNESNQFTIYRKNGLIGTVSDNLDWPNETVDQIIKFLSLSEREDYLDPPVPFVQADVYPWRFSRSLSYVRRPLIVFKRNGTEYVGWGIRHLFEAHEYILDKIISGNLKPKYESPQMLQWVAKKKGETGDIFVREVFNMLTQHPNLIVDEKVNKISGKRIGFPGNDLGDIDILLIVPKTKTVFPIECKDLLIAKTPVELSREIGEIVQGTENKRSATEKHSRRCEWVRENLGTVLNEYECSPKGMWKIEPLIMVSNELMSPHFQSSAIPIVSKYKFEEDYIPQIV